MQITPELIVAIVGIVGAGLNYWYTRSKSAAESRDIDATAAKKLSEAAATLSGEIQEHIVNELKHQLKIYSERIDRLELLTAHQEQKLAEQDATIREQGKRIAEQDTTIKEQGKRITYLEHENGNLKAENEQLRRGGNKL